MSTTDIHSSVTSIYLSITITDAGQIHTFSILGEHCQGSLGVVVVIIFLEAQIGQTVKQLGKMVGNLQIKWTFVVINRKISAYMETWKLI